MSLPPGDLGAQKIRLVDAMQKSRRPAGGSPRTLPTVASHSWRLYRDTQTNIIIEDLCAAEVYALLGGMLWRSVELFVNALLGSPDHMLLDVLLRVEEQLVKNSAGDGPSYTSLWEPRNNDFRNNVLAAALLPVHVVESDLVLSPARGMAVPRTEAVHDTKEDEGDISQLPRKDLLNLRIKLAREAYLRPKTYADLTWGDELALRLFMANRGTRFRPSLNPLFLLRALGEAGSLSPSLLWNDLRKIVQVFTEPARNQYDTDGRPLAVETKLSWCGWELFMLHWEVLVSAARAVRQGQCASTTYSRSVGGVL